ncbi:sensor histidine kinase KdpD [Asticcacaulis sp. EMRT-3]|uniref:sensor histidine kinase KdpD n=1 Tax=Asticcacaulis sp. EMRT-3 TaxID=3040349 RepID=UPI0024AEF947|nr:sensor histidine kinase KdpD [Asticcacaulis sp. EMRT-3]MDI7776013.1 sensor histidine kinase KdpD [Asticcacaulis sp. EMRT-3]
MNSDTRPDPDKLLALVRKDGGEDAPGTTRRGRLKIFFGASAGVGKTYAMLSEARARSREGRDVVIGVVETHGRSETASLTEDMELVPRKAIDHRGVAMTEFDLDAALARKPSLILIDEFAHSNAPGSRHPKRWQDVEELLDNGVDVYTTLNVQHLESVNDQVARLTGVWVRETVPDRVFDAADEIALIDIPSDELLRRLADGKVYVAEGASRRAAENFFKKSNLLALRELALRRTAERVDAQSDELSAALGRDEPQLGQKIMALIGPDPLSMRLIRHAARMAKGMRAPLCAVYLQGERHERLDERARDRVEQYLRLAEHMGARIVRLSGAHPARDILAYARQTGFTRIVVGHRKPPLWAFWRPSFAQQLIAGGEGLEIAVLHGDRGPARREAASTERAPGRLWLRPFLAQPLDYALAAGGVALCTGLGLPFRDHTPSTNLAMIYLTGVVVIAARLGLGPSVLASLLSVPAFNFFFTQPYYSFNFYDTYYYITLAFMLVTSLLVGSLTARLSLNVQQVSDRERETQGLYDLSRALSAERGVERICEVAVAHLTEPYDLSVTVFVRNGPNLRPFPASALSDDMKEMSAVNWVAANGQMAGRDTDTLPSAVGLYLPLSAEGETIGVLGLIPNDGARPFRGPEILQFGTAAGLIAGALQRARRSDEAAQSRVESENERLRNVLLSSLSHDLRTPLTVMNNSVSTLVRMRKDLPRKAMDELTSLWSQLTRLQKFVSNLLSMAAITSGQMQFNFQPYTIQEIIGAALSHTEAGREQRTVRTQMTGVLPLVRIDGALIEQVLVNLIENAYQHTASDGDILIQAEPEADRVRVRVSDNGGGLKPGDEAQIFEQFQTGQTVTSDRSGKGSGLGLAICRGVIRAHGGVIYARNNRAPRSGASFIFTLPVAE